MCALEGRKNKHQLLCKTSLTGFEFLSWLGVGNRQLRPEMGTGEQMPGETRSGQGNKSQHFPTLIVTLFTVTSLTGPTVESQGSSKWRLEHDNATPRAPGGWCHQCGRRGDSEQTAATAEPGRAQPAQASTGFRALPGPLTITTGSQAGLSSFVWATRIPAQIHLTLNPLLQWVLLNAACLMLFLKD